MVSDTKMFGLPGRVVQFRDKLTEESSDTSRVGPATKALEDCVSFLRKNNFNVDLPMAKLAILVHSKRNLLCLAKVGDPAMTYDLVRLGQAILSDISMLRQLLPESLMPYCGEWWRITEFYLDSQGFKPQRMNRRAMDDTAKALNKTNLDGGARDQVQALSQSTRNRIPMNCWNAPSGRERGNSDPIPRRPSKRSASGSPLHDGAPGTDDNSHPFTMTDLAVVDARNIRRLLGRLLWLLLADKQRGRQLLQDICSSTERALQELERDEEASARKRARKGVEGE